jgi:hypothetical protein
MTSMDRQRVDVMERQAVLSFHYRLVRDFAAQDLGEAFWSSAAWRRSAWFPLLARKRRWSSAADRSRQSDLHTDYGPDAVPS